MTNDMPTSPVTEALLHQSSSNYDKIWRLLGLITAHHLFSTHHLPQLRSITAAHFLSELNFIMAHLQSKLRPIMTHLPSQLRTITTHLPSQLRTITTHLPSQLRTITTHLPSQLRTITTHLLSQLRTKVYNDTFTI